MTHKHELFKCDDVIRCEDEQLIKRRKAIYGEDLNRKQLHKTRFGIALSGGGIRSATINLGLLKTLNTFGILKRADYLSTVSGGGYTGAYVQALLREKGTYDALFQDEQIEYLRSRGAYMIPGTGWWKSWNTILLTVGFLVSLVMSWLSPALVIVLFHMVYVFLSKLLRFEKLTDFNDMFSNLGILEYGLYFILAIFVLHTLANLILRYHVSISRSFNHLEATAAIIFLLWFIVYYVTSLQEQDFIIDTNPLNYGLIALLLILIGFYANPNALSFHRFYRNQLADAFLHFAGSSKNTKLKNIWQAEKDHVNAMLAPYPIINTCLNLQSTSDPKFKGAKANDYFLLSPLFCGSKLTNYISTKDTPDYRDITLPAATTVSAAAVNPGMGMYSNKLLSVTMTIFNARLGFWILNPSKINKWGLVWWPLYFFYELFSKIGTENRMLNISDGGHIENLAVYELLRRKCRLILAVDAGADPLYGFYDLENLTIRVRNELGLEISFPPGENPEDIIRPKPSHGYSEKRFSIAKVYQLWDEVIPEDENGQPILDKEGEPLEVLINYKDVRDAIAKLSKEECQQLKEVLEVLDIPNYVDNLLFTIKDPNEIKKLYDEYNLEDNVREVFETLLQVFQGAKQVLEHRLKHKLEDIDEERRVLRKIIEVIDEKAKNLLVVSTLVYIKSSVVAPQRKLELTDKNSFEYQTYKYKVYHPSFPHEPTADQFFDRVQWESYYRLGQHIGADVLGVKNLLPYFNKEQEAPQFGFEELLWHFDEGIDLFEIAVPTKKPEVGIKEPEIIKSRGVEPVVKEIEGELTVPEFEEATAGAAPPSSSEEVEDPEFGSAPQAPRKIVVGGEDEYSM
jgi:hypothetical protein